MMKNIDYENGIDGMIKVRKITSPTYYLVGSDDGFLLAKTHVTMINRLLEVLNEETLDIKKRYKKIVDEKIRDVKKPILAFIKDHYGVDYNDESQEELLGVFDVKCEQQKFDDIREKMKSLGIDTSMNFVEFDDFMRLFDLKRVDE